MSRTASRQGTKSLRKNGRTESRRRRRETQRQWWQLAIGIAAELTEETPPVPENLQRRWRRRGQLGGAS